MNPILERFNTLRTAMEGRASLIVVSKTQPASHLLPLLAARHRLFGENRVQEAQQKWPALRALYPDIELHLIGALQSNKAAEALGLFEVIQTVDREKLARALANTDSKARRTKAFYVQVNTGEETQKAGIAPQQALEFVRYCQQDLRLPVTGLMAIPPADAPPSPHFALLRKLASILKLPNISMGMSNDWPQALDLGATHCRIGSAIFAGSAATATPTSPGATPAAAG